jgi:MoaA/NifB/PqqE/SkfB family radical SAM enzyme
MNLNNFLKQPKTAFPHNSGKSSLQPIERWLEMIYSRDDTGDSLQALRAIYRDHYPAQGELIFTGACEFECQHCIYPPDYAQFNRNISLAEWEKVLEGLRDLGIETFVYGGRSVTRAGMRLLSAIRTSFPEAPIGMIDNGISMIPFREEIVALGLDWIDISLDGLENDHDLQRGRKGSFKEGLQGALWLKEHEAAPKVNILSCLTTLNRYSVIPMIKEINAQGFKNFFVTPVTIVKKCRPDTGLMLSGMEFANFIRELEQAMGSLDDAWVELNIFGIEYVSFIFEHYPGLWKKLQPEHEHLSWRQSRNGNELIINYYPSSLTGIREFIINTNGDAIFPKVAANGKISEREVIGSLLNKSGLEIVKQLPDAAQFEFYYNEF